MSLSCLGTVECLTIVEPAPVGVDDDLAGDVAAAAGGAALPVQLGVSLGLEGADLLGRGHRGEGESSKGEHCNCRGCER